MMEYKELCAHVCALAREVGRFLKEERLRLDALTAETKGVHDYVTRFDRESERRLVAHLRELLPESGFIAEEGTAGQTGSERFVWIVDPLDGTTNYIHRLPVTCVSIGLREGEEMVLGVVYELWADECFAAYKDGPATLNGEPIHVSNSLKMNDSLVATGFPYTQFDRLEQYMRFLEWTMRNTHGVRRLGSAAADLAYTACGRCDGFYEYGLKPYDVAAGAFIVQQAGGQVSDFAGGPNWLFGGEIIASNPHIFNEMQSTLHQYMNA